MPKKISELPTTSPVQNTDYTIVFDLESGQTKKATRLDFKGEKGDKGDPGVSGATIDTSNFAQKSQNLADMSNVITARNNILPDKTGNGLKVLRVNAGATDYEVSTLSTGVGDMLLDTPQTNTAIKTFNKNTFLDKGSLFYDVRAYGALCDGASDDQTAVQNAIDAASNSWTGSGIVLFPTGTCMVRNLVMKDAVILRGANNNYELGTIIKRRSDSDTALPLIEISGGDSASHINDSKLENIIVHNNDMAGVAIRSFYASKIELNHVWIHAATQGHGFFGVELYDSRFNDCRIEYCGDAGHASVMLQNSASATTGTWGYSADTCNQIFFNNCVWEANQSVGLQLDSLSFGSTQELNGIYLDNCKFESDSFIDSFIKTDANSTYVFVRNLSLVSICNPAGYSGGDKPLLSLGGRQSSWENIFMVSIDPVASCGMNFIAGAAGTNKISGVFCNWNSNPVPSILIDASVDTSFTMPFFSVGTSDGGTPIVDNSGFVPLITTEGKVITWIISNPAVGGVAGPRINTNCTVTRIDSFCVGATSATFNIEERSTIGSAGSNLLSTDQVATTTGASATSFADASLSNGNWMWIDISAVSGTPTQLAITLSIRETLTINH